VKQGEAARKAVELNPNLAAAQIRLAGYYLQTADYRRADEHSRRAAELDPEDPLVMGSMASSAISRGDLDEAIQMQRRVVVRDPLSPLGRHILGALLLGSGQLDEAMSEYRKVLDLNPDPGPDVRIDMVRILVLQRRYDEASAAVSQLTDGNFRDYGLALLYQVPGRRGEADAALLRLAARPGDVMDSVRLAEVYAFRGRHDEAFASLQRQRAALQRDAATAPGWIRYLQDEMHLSPFLTALHADPRWAALI
jgi:tetratricopeptide (TPR) repeat protein